MPLSPSTPPSSTSRRWTWRESGAGRRRDRVRDAQIAERDAGISGRPSGSSRGISSSPDKLRSLPRLWPNRPSHRGRAPPAALCRQQRAVAISRRSSPRHGPRSPDSSTRMIRRIFSSTREELHRVRLELDEMIPLDEHRRVVASLEAGIARTGHGRRIPSVRFWRPRSRAGTC